VLAMSRFSRFSAYIQGTGHRQSLVRMQRWFEEVPDAGQQVLQPQAGIGPDITCTASLRLRLLAGICRCLYCEPFQSPLPRPGAKRRPAP
jgi:hypothetical protein